MTGEDAGLLVHATGDPRDELVVQALPAPQEAERDDVAHAVRPSAAGRPPGRTSAALSSRWPEC